MSLLWHSLKKGAHHGRISGVITGYTSRWGASRVQMGGDLAGDRSDSLWAGHPGLACHHSRGLLLVFGVFAVAAGIFAILEGLRTEERRRRWLYLAVGVVAALAGIVALAWPAITARALLYLIAAWAIVTGVIELAGAFRTRLVTMPERVLLASGAISVVFGILLLVWPRLGVLALVWLIGIFAIVYGILHLVLAFTGGSARKAAAV